MHLKKFKNTQTKKMVSTSYVIKKKKVKDLSITSEVLNKKDYI